MTGYGIVHDHLILNRLFIHALYDTSSTTGDTHMSRINFIPASDIRLTHTASFGIRNARHAYAITVRHDNVLTRLWAAIFG